MALFVTQSPINPDTRGWMVRLLGEPWHPIYAYPPSVVHRVLHDADQQNRRHMGHWRGRIGKITLKALPPRQRTGRECEVRDWPA
jgi:hypothetical protein